jgi:hypothetical protein
MKQLLTTGSVAIKVEGVEYAGLYAVWMMGAGARVYVSRAGHTEFVDAARLEGSGEPLARELLLRMVDKHRKRTS